MTPGEEKAARFMKELGALWTFSTLKIAGKTPQIRIFDTLAEFNASNAHKVMVPAVPKDQVREGMLLSVSMLNLPSTIRNTEHALKHILTTFHNALMEADLPIPRYIFGFEADEEVGGEQPTVTTMNFCTKNGDFQKMSRAW